MTATAHDATYTPRILEQLLKLRAAGALPLRRLPEVEGLWRWGFRAGGMRVEIDLDSTVLELRAYAGRHVIAVGRVRAPVFAALTSGAEGVRDSRAADESLAALRAIVGEWRTRNARLFMEPPRVARHPDGWNNA